MQYDELMSGKSHTDDEDEAMPKQLSMALDNTTGTPFICFRVLVHYCFLGWEQQFRCHTSLLVKEPKTGVTCHKHITAIWVVSRRQYTK